MPFLTEPEPPRGLATEIRPGIRRLVARNPSVMTYLGTNSYLIEGPEGLTVLDPGPKDEDHVQDLITAAGASGVSKIIVTHGHSDHSGAALRLRELTGAPIFAHRDYTHPADLRLEEGSEVAGLTALHTPGHAADHLCFALDVAGQQILFSGDHVMSWSSSIVSPPDGKMSDYYRSLELLLRRDDDLYLSGHGPPLSSPQALVAELLSHRNRREAAILSRLKDKPKNVAALAASLYNKSDWRLKAAAERNVLAHLLKLVEEGVVRELDPPSDPPDSARDPKRRFTI